MQKPTYQRQVNTGTDINMQRPDFLFTSRTSRFLSVLTCKRGGQGEEVDFNKIRKTSNPETNLGLILLREGAQEMFSSVQFSRSVVSDSLRHHGLPHGRPPCPSSTLGVYSNSCPLNRWCHPTISSSVICFSSCLQSFPASGSFQMSQFFASGSQRIGVSASSSVLPMNIQDWFPLGWTGWISLQSKGLSRVFSNNTVQKHQFFSTQLSL